jgi:hypothetical protein
MRRELRELAKLAQAKRQEVNEARSSGEWTYLPAVAGSESVLPTEAPSAPPGAQPAALDVTNAIEKPSPSQLTVPPVVPSAAAPALASEGMMAPRNGGRRAILALSAAGAAGLLIFIGAAGRSTVGRAAAVSTPVPNREIQAAATAMTAQSPGTPGPPVQTAESATTPPPPAASAPPAAATTPVAAVQAPSAASQRPATHRAPAPVRRTSAASAAAPKAAAPAPASGSGDSLADLMRKAVGSPSGK